MALPRFQVKSWESVAHDLTFAFEPIVNIHNGVCFGFEARLQGWHAAGFESIAHLVETAEAEGVLLGLETTLQEKAIDRFAAIKPAVGAKLFYNLHRRVIAEDTFRIQPTADILGRHHLTVDTICFEIPSTLSHANIRGIIEKLRFLRATGFKIALDHCGKDYAGHQLICQVEPDFIKIDATLIEAIRSDQKIRMFASSLGKLAQLIGAVTIADGIATRDEFYSCRDFDCRLAQGSLIGEPESVKTRLKKSYDHIEQLSRSDERSLNKSDRRLIRAELDYIEPIRSDSEMIDVFEKFRVFKEEHLFPVVDSTGYPIGVIRDSELKEYTFSQYGRDLLLNPFYRKTLTEFIDPFPVADLQSPIEDILDTYSTFDNLEGILIVDGMVYAGFFSAQSLLKVLHEKNLAIARDQNPLTKLPGNTLIHEYLSTALADRGTGYTLVCFDFDNFKPFNDRYGFRIGDRVIQLFGKLLQEIASSRSCFVGHIGGDDFFMGVRGRHPDETCGDVARLVAKFRSEAESFHDPEAIEAGCIRSRDRAGDLRRFPLLTVSAVVVNLKKNRSRYYRIEQVSDIIARMKDETKHSERQITVHCLE